MINIFSSPNTSKHDQTVSFAIAFLIHVGVLAAIGSAVVKPVEFAVDSRITSIEVSLAAAPQNPVVVPQDKENILIPDPIPQEEISLPLKEPIKEMESIEAKTPPNEESVIQTQHPSFDSGAVALSKPNYLRNPAPAYPTEARKLKQEGLVILNVVVDRKGYPSKTDIKKSSGYPLLDEAALKAVRRWKFSPASISGLPVESAAEIPVRFRLKNGS